MDKKVENKFEQLEKALESYRQSLKNTEDEPGETARQYAKVLSELKTHSKVWQR